MQKSLKKSHLKGKAFILFDFFFKSLVSGGMPPRSPLDNLNVFIFVLTCLSGLVLVTDMANTF